MPLHIDHKITLDMYMMFKRNDNKTRLLSILSMVLEVFKEKILFVESRL